MRTVSAPGIRVSADSRIRGECDGTPRPQRRREASAMAGGVARRAPAQSSSTGAARTASRSAISVSRTRRRSTLPMSEVGSSSHTR